MKVDMNEFARRVTLAEGKKHSVSIGDVKEILTITLEFLAELKEDELNELLGRYRR